MLDQLKGALIELRYGAETVRGAILSGRVVRGEGTAVGPGVRIPGEERRENLLLLLDSGEMRNFDLSAAASIRLLDPVLQTQFQAYLAALVSSRSKDKRSVYIDSTGTEARELFETLLACRNRHGLLAEDIDPVTREQWGNFVQTYSMVGLISAAIRLSVRWDQAF